MNKLGEKIAYNLKKNVRDNLYYKLSSIVFDNVTVTVRDNVRTKSIWIVSPALFDNIKVNVTDSVWVNTNQL